MKTKLLAATALAALALGAASAQAAIPGADIGPQIATESSVTPIHFRYTYREFWRGNCLYRTVYVTDGNRWRYRWRRTCYGRYTE